MPYVGKKPADIIATAIDTTTGDFSGVVTANAGIKVDNITIDATEVDLSSGTFTIDSASDITLDADGGGVLLKDGGTEFGRIFNSSSDLILKSAISDKDMKFQGNDGGSAVNALILDMSDAGTATFNHDILLGDNGVIRLGASADLLIYHDGSHSYVQDNGTGNIRIKGANIEMVDNDDGGSLLQAVQGGAVQLFHNNSERIATTSSGVTVTGNLTVGDIKLTAVTLPGAGIPGITLRNTDNNIYHQSGSGNSIIFIDSSQNTMHNISPTTHVFNISNAELMRINNKGLLINTNETLHSGVERSLEVLNHSGNGFAAIFKGGTAGHEVVAIHNSATSGTRILLVFKTSGSTGTLVGRVTSDGSSTTYATSSDYRLKENVTYDFDATTRLKQLKPARFNWIADEDNKTVDGFIAHEVSSIVPEAVNGEKDAMTEELLYVDGDEIPEGKKVGDVKEASKIDPQGIDQSKLVPLLTKALQEQQATIEALTARIVTLENA